MTDVQNKIEDAKTEEERLLAEQEEQRKAALLAEQQKNQQPEVGGNMYNALMENILGIVGREQTDLEKYTDALKAGVAGVRGFDVAMGNVGREYAQNVEQDIGLDKRLRSIEGMDVSPELKNQLVYDALGEVDMASLPEGYIEELKQAAKEPLVKKTIMDNQPLPDPDYLKV